MADITKKAIAASMIKLCGTKKLNKITVKDIVDDCGVNRNTFYYHFEDVYDLLDYIFKEEEKAVLSQVTDTDNWLDAVFIAIDNLKNYKDMIINVYNSVNREQLEKYLYHIGEQLFVRYFNIIYPRVDTSLENFKIIVDFYNCATVGIILKWIGEGMKGDVKALANKLKIMSEGIVEKSLENMNIRFF